MVEGARLESVYTREGIAGSNPALSALLLKKDFKGAQNPVFVRFLFWPECQNISKFWTVIQ